MPTFEYRKSSYSNDKSECVEIATNIPTTIAVRDSKNPTGPSLQLHPTTWSAFQASLLPAAAPDQELRARLRAERKITGSSSYVSAESAQDLTDRAIVQRQHDVRRWLENTSKKELEIEVDFGDEATGRSMSREDFIRGTGPHDVHKVFLLLRRDPDMPSGYRIHTSYPVA